MPSLLRGADGTEVPSGGSRICTYKNKVPLRQQSDAQNLNDAVSHRALSATYDAIAPIDNHVSMVFAPPAGFEPATARLTVECSAVELRRNNRGESHVFCRGCGA